MTSTSIFRIIISKFSYKKELGLIILFVINKNLEIGLYYMVLALGLAIDGKQWRAFTCNQRSNIATTIILR